MAYTVHFRFQWRSANENGNVYKIDILENGYSGAVVQRPLGGAPLLRRKRNGAICGTSLEFMAQALVDGEFATLYTPSSTALRVDLYQGSVLIWQGYITPELYSEPYVAPPYNVRATATDNLGELKMSYYTARGSVTIEALLSYILGATGMSFPVHWLSAMYMSSPAAFTPAQMASSATINLDHMEGETLYDVLDKVLGTLHAFIVQYGCGWLIVRECDIEYLRNGNVITAADGTTFGIADFGSMASNIWWPVGYLSQTVMPAKKSKIIKAPNNWVKSLLGETPLAYSGAVQKYTPTDGTSAYWEICGYNSSRVPTVSSITFRSLDNQGGMRPAMDLTLSLSIQTNGVLSNVASGYHQSVYGAKCAEVYVRVAGSDGGNYVMRYIDKEGNLTTDAVPALDIDAIGRDSPERFGVNVPISSKQTEAGWIEILWIDVTVKTYIDDYGYSRLCLYDWTLNAPERNKGYQVTCQLNNGARGADDDVEIAAADNDDKGIEDLLITNGLKYAAGTGHMGEPIEEWASGNILSMPLLEFLARDYSLSIAVPRLRMEGTLNIPNGAALPLLFRGGGLIYWPETWDWNLGEDRLKVSMLSLPAATVQVTSVTRTAQGTDGFTGGYYTGGGSKPSGGGGEGTVTSVAMTVPTGFSVAGSPVTVSGTLALAFAEGYSLPKTEDVTKGVTAYGWGDHSQAGYLTGITSQMIVNALGFTPTANTGTVTSVKVTTPTGLRVSNGSSQTITGSGTFALQLASGYAIPKSNDMSSWSAGVQTANSAFAAAVTNRVDNASGITDNNYNLVTANAIYDKFNGSAALMPVATRSSNYNKISDNNEGDTYLITAGAVAKYVQANRSLNDLTDVQVNGPSNGDFFCYSSADSKWTNVAASGILRALIGSEAIGGADSLGDYRPIYWTGSAFSPIPSGSIASGNHYPVTGNTIYTHFLNTVATMTADTETVTTSQSKVPTSYAVSQYVGKITDSSTSTWNNNTGCLTGAAMYGFLQESSLMPVSKYADTVALPNEANNDGYFRIPSETGQALPGDNHLATCSLIYKYIHKHWWNVKDAIVGAAAACSLETAPSGTPSRYGADDVIMTQKAANYKMRNFITGTISTGVDQIKRGDRVIVMGDDLYGALQEWGLIP